MLIYLYHDVVLILSNTIVSMKDQVSRLNCKCGQEVMQEADSCVGSFPAVNTLIYQVVHLNWSSLTADSKNATFPWG